MAQEPYKMPKTHIGMVVLWYDGGRRVNNPCPALVTDVADTMVDLSVIVPMSLGLTIKQGVRHADNPDVRRIDQAEVGVWDYTPETKALMELSRKINSDDRAKKAS